MYKQRIVIVGAGIIGLSTAYALLKQGMQHVTVLEQATVDHQQGESHGLSRLLRFEYGTDLFYSEMVQMSLEHWRSLEDLSGCSLFTPTGLLALGNEDDNFTQSSYHTLRELGLPTQRLSQSACSQLFPQFNTQAYTLLTYNTEGGMLHASACLHALKDMILKLGGHICESARVVQLINENSHVPIRVQLSWGEELTADRVVLAIGPWVHHLLKEFNIPVRLTRQYLLYFANLPITSYGLHTFPAFIADDLYGFPIHSSCAESGPRWLKAASHNFGPTVDPDEAPSIDMQVITQIKSRLCDLLPALEQAQLARIDACMYDVSPDEDFILDYLPYDQRIIFATGLTGHGFKFGLVLGELLSSLVCETSSIVSMERFQLARFAQQPTPQKVSAAEMC